MNIGPIKALISFRFDEPLRFDISDPRKTFGSSSILNGILRAAASLSNAPLSYR